MMRLENQKKQAKCWLLALALPTLLILFNSPLAPAFEKPSSKIEKMRFYDWQVGISSEREIKKCSVRFTGFSQKKILLSMTLSLVKTLPGTSEADTLTILKISAAQVMGDNFSDPVSIVITEGWVETSTETSLGKIKDIHVGPAPHFLGGREGSGLYFSLLRGMQKDRTLIGYRSKNDGHERLFQVFPPPLEIFEKLRACYTEKA